MLTINSEQVAVQIDELLRPTPDGQEFKILRGGLPVATLIVAKCPRDPLPIPLDREQARNLVLADLLKHEQNDQEPEAIIDDELTYESDWCFVFHYQSKKWFETLKDEHRFIRNAPYIVDRITGDFLFSGTAWSIDYYLGWNEGRRSLVGELV